MSENTAPVNEEQLNAENQQEMNELFAQRLQKAEDLKAMGINPYGERFDNHEKIADCRAKFNPEAPEGEIRRRPPHRRPCHGQINFRRRQRLIRQNPALYRQKFNRRRTVRFVQTYGYR